MNDNPLEDSPEREARIRVRAYLLWEQGGKPDGRDDEFWERARELVAIEDHPAAGLLPNPLAPSPEPAAAVEDAEVQENLGEFPSPLTDPGDPPQAPGRTRSRGRPSRKSMPGGGA